MQIFLETVLLYGLGLVGWKIASKIKLPAPHILGTMVLIGTLRIIGWDLPFLRQDIIIGLQIFLGLIIGSRFDKKAFESARGLGWPVLIVSFYALVIAFITGGIVSSLSSLDLYTAILGSSIGGLPEMTILALATDADVVAVVLFHICRLIVALIAFPIAIRLLNNKSNRQQANQGDFFINQQQDLSNNSGKSFIFTLLGAGFSGFLLNILKVPAGPLIGSLLFMMLGLNFNLKVFLIPNKILPYLLVGVGIMISNQISPQSAVLLLSGELWWPLILTLIITFISSFLIAVIIAKKAKWNLTTAVLAAAPAGLSVMAGLALETGNSPVLVSLLHLCRLITLKIGIPFLFMLFSG